MLVAGNLPSVLTHCAVTVPLALLTCQMALSTSSWRPVAKVNEFAADSGGEPGVADKILGSSGCEMGRGLTRDDATEVGVAGGPNREVGGVTRVPRDPTKEGEVRDAVL